MGFRNCKAPRTEGFSPVGFFVAHKKAQLLLGFILQLWTIN